MTRLNEDQRLHAAYIIEEFGNKVVMDMGGDLEDIIEVCRMVADQEETAQEEVDSALADYHQRLAIASDHDVKSSRECEVAGSDWAEGKVREGMDPLTPVRGTSELTEDEEAKWETWEDGASGPRFIGG